jgi:hypothetical protein
MSSDKKGVWYWLKTSVLFVGRGVLFVLGVLFLALIVMGQFEFNFSFWEVSTFEVVFWFVFISVSIRHYHRCRLANLKIFSIIYRPVRNLGWIFFIALAVLGGAVITNDDFAQELFVPHLTPSALLLDELITAALVLACIFWASPNVEEDEVVEPEMGAAV